jgi:hypothetical protein
MEEDRRLALKHPDRFAKSADKTEQKASVETHPDPAVVVKPCSSKPAGASYRDIVIAFQSKLAMIAELDKLEAAAETRRNNRLALLDFYRRQKLEEICATADQIIDGEYSEASLAPEDDNPQGHHHWQTSADPQCDPTNGGRGGDARHES